MVHGLPRFHQRNRNVYFLLHFSPLVSLTLMGVFAQPTLAIPSVYDEVAAFYQMSFWAVLICAPFSTQKVYVVSHGFEMPRVNTLRIAAQVV